MQTGEDPAGRWWEAIQDFTLLWLGQIILFTIKFIMHIIMHLHDFNDKTKIWYIQTELFSMLSPPLSFFYRQFLLLDFVSDSFLFETTISRYVYVFTFLFKIKDSAEAHSKPYHFHSHFFMLGHMGSSPLFLCLCQSWNLHVSAFTQSVHMAWHLGLFFIHLLPSLPYQLGLCEQSCTRVSGVDFSVRG